MSIQYNYGELRANLDIRAERDELLGSPVDGAKGALAAMSARIVRNETKKVNRRNTRQTMPKGMTQADLRILRTMVGMAHSGLTIETTQK